MKKILFPLLMVALLSSCNDDDSAIKVDSNLLVGKWEMHSQYRNGGFVKAPDNDCSYDKWWEFKADGMVYNSNPCEYGVRVDMKCNWSVKGDILYIDGMVQLPACPVVTMLTQDTLKIQYMFGSFETIDEVFVRTNRTPVDYAGDAAGKYLGTSYYSEYYLSDNFRGDSVENITVDIDKMMPNYLKYNFNDILVMGETNTIVMDSVRTSSVKGFRTADLYREGGFDEFRVAGVWYDTQSYAVFNNDSVWINFQIAKLGQILEYHRFVGARVEE